MNGPDYSNPPEGPAWRTPGELGRMSVLASHGTVWFAAYPATGRRVHAVRAVEGPDGALVYRSRCGRILKPNLGLWERRSTEWLTCFTCDPGEDE